MDRYRQIVIRRHAGSWQMDSDRQSSGGMQAVGRWKTTGRYRSHQVASRQVTEGQRQADSHQEACRQVADGQIQADSHQGACRQVADGQRQTVIRRHAGSWQMENDRQIP